TAYYSPFSIFNSVDSYCTVECENFNYRTLVCRSTSNPKWDILLIFLRKLVDKPITIDVWDANILKDSFLGRAVIRCPISNDVKTETIQLGSKKNRRNDSISDKFYGLLKVEVVTYNNTIYL
uniref:C2 domain-containing protein n=1 Tax=Romanomermis culicivorax TaxID=13658 RepID=A0A915JDI9_ROMCU